MEASINVIYSLWGTGQQDADGNDIALQGGVQPYTVTEANATALAGAVAAHVVELVDPSPELLALLAPHVESQEDSEAAYRAAVASGAWREGHLQQWIPETERRLALTDEDANLTEGGRAYLRDGLEKANAELAQLNPDAHADVTDLVNRQTAAAAGEEG